MNITFEKFTEKHIDEAVKLAAKFSTEKSTDFVNGILARYAKEINRG